LALARGRCEASAQWILNPLLLLLYPLRHGYDAVDLPAGLAADRAPGGGAPAEGMGATLPRHGALLVAILPVLVPAS
jgi:hypothetical protein